MLTHPNLKLWYNAQNIDSIVDLSGNSFTGSKVGTPTVTTGVIGKAFQTGTGNFVRCDSISGIDGNSYTYCCWFYITTFSSSLNCLISVGGDTYDQLLYITNSGFLALTSYSTSFKSVASNVSIAGSTWYFGIGTRDYTNQTLTLHLYSSVGILLHTVSVALGADNAALYTGPRQAVSVGGRGYAGNNYNHIGRVGSPMVFNHAVPVYEHRRLLQGFHPLTRS